MSDIVLYHYGVTPPRIQNLHTPSTLLRNMSKCFQFSSHNEIQYVHTPAIRELSTSIYYDATLLSIK